MKKIQGLIKFRPSVNKEVFKQGATRAGRQFLVCCSAAFLFVSLGVSNLSQSFSLLKELAVLLFIPSTVFITWHIVGTDVYWMGVCSLSLSLKILCRDPREDLEKVKKLSNFCLGRLGSWWWYMSILWIHCTASEGTNICLYVSCFLLL